ncbi:PBS lyase HEAT domain protein repeat-containing protein [Stanieria cyanosphaera PCC 7437]|uniref:PBS lyase HEAT domain protein repeat-containing protein n=1 Tax=Stanieria cyanosphaera (strain ATCC 29371 / PCC 7437) TaxID=111780 RepID=K9XWD0_STAC7|nr:HEAT repeat domain-containing protein [Stanieria cyanosphaera]AFZ36895.1 PBS lyase HEAT domain protein repeat-containing protein [Stanieria cyanosphaera PCC 7437]
MSITPESVGELLNSEDFGDRIRGINLLRQIEPEIAFELVKPIVKDQNTRVRYAAISQLDTVGIHNPTGALEILRDRLFNDPEADVQAAAADAIAGLKLTEAYDDLALLYHQTSDWLIQFSIVAALGELGEPRGFELLQEALTSDNNLLQTAAIGALGELGNPRAVPLLIPFVNHEDWQIRYRLAQALGRLGGEEAQQAIAQLSQDSVEQVAHEARINLNQ